MWDHKSANTISALDKETDNTLPNSGLQDKKIFQSEGQDSGFLSGQNLSSSDIDYDIDDIKEINTTDTTSSSLATNINSNKQQQQSYTDSGAIDDDYDNNSCDLAKDSKQQQSQKMIIDSGVDLGLEEWFCGLNIKNSNQQSNNLGKPCRKTKEEPKFAKITKKLQTVPLWQMCYVQDDDGDT